MLPDETVPATPISLLPRRHCVMKTHTVENDFKKCIKQYERCGRAPGFTRVHALAAPAGRGHSERHTSRPDALTQACSPAASSPESVRSRCVTPSHRAVR